MSFENPTGLRVGQEGNLEGWRCRIAGRVVMGMECDGERYYWQEFNLTDSSGGSRTLVYEEGDDGPEWKLFELFEPVQPLTSVEAGRKQVGDLVNLDGTSRRVTLVDQSRVFHLEGQAPEGVEVGDVANYFNVDTGPLMLVASWSGSEIEFYQGHDVPETSVYRAFAVQPPTTGVASLATASHGSWMPVLRVCLILIAAVLLIFAVAYSCSQRPSRHRGPAAHPIPRQDARPTLRLATGSQGQLGADAYIVRSVASATIGSVSGRYTLREYRLQRADDTEAILVNGANGSPYEWLLLRAVAPPVAMTPHEAAALKVGGTVVVGGAAMRITRLLRFDVREGEGTAAPARVHYGFLAETATERLVARWTESALQFLRGTTLPQAEVAAAFGPGPEADKKEGPVSSFEKTGP